MGTIAATYLEHLNSIETIEEARPRFDDDEPLGGWRGHDRYKEKLRDIERQQQRLEHDGRNGPGREAGEDYNDGSTRADRRAGAGHGND